MKASVFVLTLVGTAFVLIAPVLVASGVSDRLVNFSLAYQLQVEAYEKIRACIRDKETRTEIQDCATHEDSMLHSRVDRVLRRLRDE